MLLAHANVWHTYDKEFRRTQQGRVSIVVYPQWFEPKTDREEDIKAADHGMQWFLGWMAHPVFVNGDYPQVMKTRIVEKSILTSRLSLPRLHHLSVSWHSPSQLTLIDFYPSSS